MNTGRNELCRFAPFKKKAISSAVFFLKYCYTVVIIKYIQ